MNVIWFCLDTLRADHLSCYDYFRKTSPTIDTLASEGVLFPDSRANAVATGPAFTSMFTGQYAVNNEWYLTPFDVGNLINFPDDRPVFPELVQDGGGITTAAFDNLFQFASHMKQFVRGFEYYVNVTRSSKPIHHHVVGGTVNERLLPWIRMHKAEPFFLFVHYWDPHGPYNQPDDYARPFVHERGNLDDLHIKSAEAGYDYVPGWGTLDNIPHTEGPEEFIRNPDSPFRHPRSIDSYDGEILYTDFLIKQVLEELDGCNILDDTAVIINADHGEQLNQHYDMWGHAGLHDANIFTPLIMWRPGLLPQGTRPVGFVHHVDIAPTILDLLKVEIPESMDGESLLPLAGGKSAGGGIEGRTTYFSETMGMRSVYQGGWKYIHHKFGDDELYDLSADPVEVINLVDERTDKSEELREMLLSWVRRNLDGRHDPMLHQLARSEELRGQIRQQL